MIPRSAVALDAPSAASGAATSPAASRAPLAMIETSFGFMRHPRRGLVTNDPHRRTRPVQSPSDLLILANQTAVSHRAFTRSRQRAWSVPAAVADEGRDHR